MLAQYYLYIPAASVWSAHVFPAVPYIWCISSVSHSAMQNMTLNKDDVIFIPHLLCICVLAVVRSSTHCVQNSCLLCIVLLNCIYGIFLFLFLIIRLLKPFSLETKTNVGSPKEVLVDDPYEMFQLADLLEGVSVDCTDLPIDSNSGMNLLNLT